MRCGSGPRRPVSESGTVFTGVRIMKGVTAAEGSRVGYPLTAAGPVRMRRDVQRHLRLWRRGQPTWANELLGHVEGRAVEEEPQQGMACLQRRPVKVMAHVAGRWRRRGYQIVDDGHGVIDLTPRQHAGHHEVAALGELALVFVSQDHAGYSSVRVNGLLLSPST